ncbi:MAG: FGGY-family carbohydrate kinase [Geminicoccaceae bacterium]
MPTSSCPPSAAWAAAPWSARSAPRPSISTSPRPLAAAARDRGCARDGSIPACGATRRPGGLRRHARLARAHLPARAGPRGQLRRLQCRGVLLRPGESHLVALDWWSGNRVPLADSTLSGVLAGLTLGTTAAGVYRALMEAACYARRGRAAGAGGLAIERVILTSGLARENPLLVQLMADVLARPVAVLDIAHGTAVGAAIHGAVAGGLVADYAEGGRRFGARTSTSYAPDPAASAVYHDLYAVATARWRRMPSSRRACARSIPSRPGPANRLPPRRCPRLAIRSRMSPAGAGWPAAAREGSMDMDGVPAARRWRALPMLRPRSIVGWFVLVLGHLPRRRPGRRHVPGLASTSRPPAPAPGRGRRGVRLRRDR